MRPLHQNGPFPDVEYRRSQYPAGKVMVPLSQADYLKGCYAPHCVK